MIATWTRLVTSSLVSSRETCALTVASLTCSCWVISALDNPRCNLNRDFLLPIGQTTQRSPAALRRAGFDPAPEMVEDNAGDRRGQHRLARRRQW